MRQVSIRRESRFVLLAATFLWAAATSAQTTNLWILNNNGYWSVTNNWSPSDSYPDSAGAVAIVTNNNTYDQTIYLTDSITLGTLLWGDANRANFHGLRSTNATVTTVTFDTGDGSMALFVHGTGDRPNHDFGRYDDRTDVGFVVSDPQGLFIDNYQNFYFNGLDTTWNTDPARAFDGGGHDVTKGEDGAIYFRRVVTNIATFAQRDGFVEFNPEGQPVYMPGISNLVLGVAPGTIDTGANPSGVTTNLNEGGAYDRTQFPYFSIIGAATTNGGVVMTNGMDVTFNRGVFRSLDRGVQGYEMSNAAQAAYTGTFTLNGSADENFFIIEHQTHSGYAYNNTTAVRQTEFTGPFTGSGGFTKFGTGEMLFTGSNDFTGAVNISRAIDQGRGRWGGVGLRENGVFSGASQVTLNRDGSLFLDNSSVNLSNRLNDAAPITSRGRNQIELLANGSAESYERFGSVTNAQGSLAIEIDKVDGSPQQQTLELDRLVRTPGTVIGFHASDLGQGAFGLNGPTGIVVNLLDGGASLTQLGGGGGAGASNRSIVVGVFGGDGVDYGSGDVRTQTPNRADEFMTMDGNRLRTLDPNTEMVNLGGRVTNALSISQASASQDANVNINFGSTYLNFGVFALTNNLSQVADKRVVGDATFNSIRFGLVRGDPFVVGTLTNQPNDYGRSLLIDDGLTLRSESGMMLLGRDTGSATGDDSPNGNVWVYGGTIDLDGAANNREAIIHNASGNSIYLRAAIEARQGLTKSGTDSVVLEAANNLGGIVNIAQGNLYVRDSAALRGASEVNIQGDGILIMNYGVAITNVDLRAGERPYGGPVLISEGNHNVFGGDIMIENVDPQGVIMHDVRLRAGGNSQNATLTLLGDIGLTESGASSDSYLNDPQILYLNESGGIFNLKGTVGDRIVGGEAQPFDPTVAPGQVRVTGGYMSNRAANENYVLRTIIDGNGGVNSGDELVVNIYNPWNAAGRLYGYQGTIRFLGDPSLGQGDFWTTNALQVSDFAHGFSGFQLSGSGTDQGGSVTVLLTRDGQSFNAERWSVATDQNANNTVTMGLEHTGPSNATVTIGNDWNDINPATDDNRIYIGGASITLPREFRLLAHDGYDSTTGSNSVGTVNVIQSIRGNDYSILTTVGNGTVVLGGQAVANTNWDEGNDIRNFMLLGGELVLDRTDTYAQGVRRTADSRASLTLAGGDLTHLGRNGTTTEIMNSNLTVRAGDSRVSVVAGGGGTTELYLATNANAIVSRQRGGTVGFVEDNTAGGTANIRLAGTGFAVGRIGSWATYATNYGAGAYTWASTDASSNVIEFGEGFYSADAFGSGQHVTLDMPSALAADDVAASLRYTNAAALDLGGYSLDVTDGGILVTPTVAGAASMGNGALTSSGGELIIHNYADPLGSLAISAGITGNVDLTFSGTGRTVLSGTNTFNGVTRINGGTVEIDDASRLGGTVSNLELRGGTLFTTASMAITNRTIILGGEGGTFQVAAGTTNFIANVLSESNFLGSTRLNNGVGDLIKTGAGTLDLGSTNSTANNLTAGYNMIQGLTDVREGTLRIVANNNYALGSSKSFYDGTIVRTGATLALGSNNFRYAIQEWLMFEQGSTLRVEPTVGGYNSMQANGVMDFRGDTKVQILSGDFYFNNSGAGYLLGSGDIIKDGDGALDIGEYSPDYTGDLIVMDGQIRLQGIDNNPLPNAGSIAIGLNDTTNRGAVIFSAWTDRDGMGSTWDIDQNIAVQGYTGDTRLEIYAANHNDVVNFNGSIDLSNFGSNGWTGSEFRLTIEDQAESRTIGGADDFREEEYMNLNGDITGGDKRIRTYVRENYYSSGGYVQRMEPVPGAQLTNEMNIMAFFTFSGTNTGWTGALEVGNRAGTDVTAAGPDQDKQHFVRFGKNDGAATLAIGASNSVVLRHDATLQAYGSQVTIGNLFSDGNSGGSDGYFGQQLVTNSFLENGGTLAGSFTINQTSNRTFNAVIRDGTYYSPTSTNLAAAALSIIKAGGGVLTFDRSNYYTGTTTVREGLLQVNGSHLGGGLYSVLAGGGLGGTGLVGSAVHVADGGRLAPGMTNSGVGGTLNINADLSLSNNAILSFDLTGFDTTPGSDVNDLVQGIGNLALDGMLTITPLASFSGAGTNDFWTLLTYSGALTDNGLVVDGTSQLLLDPGLAFYVYNYEGGAIDEIRLGIMVPEPSSWALLATGLGMVAWMSRRRFRT